MQQYMVFKDESCTKSIAVLVPMLDFTNDILMSNYIAPLVNAGIPLNQIIAFNLELPPKPKKITVSQARAYLEQLKPFFDQVGVTHILCTEATYFKALAKVTSVDKCLSYRMDSLWDEQDAFYCPSWRRSMFQPRIPEKIQMACTGLALHTRGDDGIFEDSPIRHAFYPHTVADIRKTFENLLTYKELTLDIETFGLHVKEAKLGTIAFAWNKHDGVAFSIDYCSNNSRQVRRLLKEFLCQYAEQGGKLIYHGGTFDIKILIYELFMECPEDTEGMLIGLNIMFKNFEDTKSLAYLATNSAGGNQLSLKDQAFEYVGNYALDMSDITQHHVDAVLQYNLVDACATWYVRDKHWDTVIECQESIYQDIFKPSMKVIVQMELTGLPINLGEVLNAEGKLDDIRQDALDTLINSPIIQEFEWSLRQLEAEKANAKLKTDRCIKDADDFLGFSFNPGSGDQVRMLLFKELGFKSLGKTASGKPSTKAEIIKALKTHEENTKNPRPEIIEILDGLIHYAEVNILLNTFIPAFKDKSIDKNGWRHLLGSFNLGGTKSGRLSSSDPNLQNIPSTGTQFAKLIKKCFQAPPKDINDPYGWLFVGADYFSLEDRISALLTKDPNKLKVYTDGFDGHCLRAYSYFTPDMPDITAELQAAQDEATQVAIINSIEVRYPKLRQKSKGPTFALTYMGTWRTLVKNFGLTKDEALTIERNYHELYSTSDEWVRDRIAEANKTGYVELAFGLRLRTPLLPQIVLSSYDSMPYEAYKEIKTAGNALGQSYGLLNNHSANMFMNQVWKHPEYRTWILPCAQIHDSQYYLVRNHLGCLKWMNDHLIECMEWADLDPIKHDHVGLGSQLEVYWPDWSNPIKIPNRASLTRIKTALSEGKSIYLENR